MTSGSRFETYVIAEPAGSKALNIYGAAAHHAAVGDEIIIMSFAWLETGEARKFKGPRVVRLKKGNKLS